MIKTLTARDKFDISCQLQSALNPSTVVDVAIDSTRLVAYAAVAYRAARPEREHRYLPDGHIYGVVARIYDEDGNFTVTSDEMPAESMGIAHMTDYCHCPARILKKLSSPKNDLAAEWREVCKRNIKHKL